MTALALLLAACVLPGWEQPGAEADGAVDEAVAHGRHGKKKKKDKADKDDTDARAPRPPAPDAPNVLLVVWDTVRADHTSLYGYPKDTTPRMRKWAAERAVVYDRAVSPGVFTLPSHASLFTSLPVRSHGVNADQTVLGDDLMTFAEALDGAGFDTWAFVSNPYLVKGSGLMEGFAEIEKPWEKRWKGDVKAHVATKAIPKDASTPLSPAWPHEDKKNKYLTKESGPVAARAFGAWLDHRPEPERPWFAFVNYMEAHLPRIPSLEARRAVMSPEEIERSYHLVQDTLDFHAWMTGVKAYDPLDLAAIRGVYDAALIDLDAATAQLFDELEDRGLTGRTIVVLVSDHGESLGDHGLLLHKYAVWNALSRVPLAISWPGHLAPGRVAEPFPVEDALVRAAELGELPLPDGLRRTIAGRVPPPKGGAITVYDAVAEGMLDKLAKSHPTLDRARLERTWAALELGPHKLVEASDGTVQLFDVGADPAELHDAAAASPDLVRELQAALHGWQAAVPPRSPSTEAPVTLGDELREGLEALGYLQ